MHTLLCYVYKVLKQKKNETKDCFSIYTDIAHFYQKQTGMGNTNSGGTGIVEIDGCITQSPERTGKMVMFLSLVVGLQHSFHYSLLLYV